MTDDYFISNEESINIILNRISQTITDFKTLSREQAEKAILDTTNKIKECQKIISNMENNLNKENKTQEEKIEIKKKITKYKRELNLMENKFNITQNSYINKKTANALIDDNINQQDLIDEDPKKNNEKINKENNKNDMDNIIVEKIENNVFDKNIRNISNIASDKPRDEVFRSLNVVKIHKKKKILTLAIILLLIIITMGTLSIIFAKMMQNNN